MKVKNKNSIEHRFILFAFCLLMSLVGLASENPSQNSIDVDSKSGGHITHELLQNSISAPKSGEDEGKKAELRRLVEQIRSIRFETKSRPAEPAATAKMVQARVADFNELGQVSEGKEISSVMSLGGLTQQTAEKNEMELGQDSQFFSASRGRLKLTYHPVSAQTLKMLENLTQSASADQLHNYLQLAEILFLSGHLKQAEVFYEQALNRTDANDVTAAEGEFNQVNSLDPAQDRAWILFQMGNCLREYDLPSAKKVYGQLIEKYPSCLWADLAQSRVNLIDWFIKDEPQKLIPPRPASAERAGENEF